MKIIDKVCRKLSNRFTFSVYDSDDIYQEAYLICYDLLDKWDGRNLENFLTNAASNNIRTLINSKVGSSNERLKESRQKIDGPANVYDIPIDELPSYCMNDDLHEKMLFESIENDLPIEYRKNYLRLKSGSQIQHHKKEEIFSYIREKFVQSVLPRAETVYHQIEQGIIFSSGILAADEYGYIVNYTEK